MLRGIDAKPTSLFTYSSPPCSLTHLMTYFLSKVNGVMVASFVNGIIDDDDDGRKKVFRRISEDDDYLLLLSTDKSISKTFLPNIFQTKGRLK